MFIGYARPSTRDQDAGPKIHRSSEDFIQESTWNSHFLLICPVCLSPLYEFACMRDQLTESQVARVVAEVTRQAQVRELDERQVLERGQVVQILEELKLPVELLDPAMR